MAAWTATATAEPPIPPHTAVYEVLRKGDPVGRVYMRLARGADGGYEYGGHTEATSFLARLVGYQASESARFTWDRRRVRPLAYRQNEERIGHHEHFSADFDWVRRRATGDSDAGRVDLAVPADVLDPLTLRLQLAVDLAAGRLDPAYPTVDSREVDYHRFERQGIETVTVGTQCIDALRLERLRPDSSRRLWSWHSPTFRWLPVRILQQRDGKDLLDIRLVASDLLAPGGTCPTTG